jgi:predicted permease
MMATLWQDIRYGFRMMVKNPGLAAVVISSLVIGITLNTVVFSMADGMWLRPMPFRDPKSIVHIFAESPTVRRGSFSYPDYLQLQKEMRSLAGLAAVGRSNVVLFGEEVSEVLPADVVSRNFFTVLGVKPRAGRFFREEDEPSLRDQLCVVLSYALWQRRFGGDRNLIGRSIVLSGRSATVLGVAPSDFTGVTRRLSADLWYPAENWGRPEERASRSRWFALVGRLRVNYTALQAQAEVATRLPNRSEGSTDVPQRIAVLSRTAFQSENTDAAAPVFLMAIAATVLVIACANISGLLLARAEVRQREMAIRAGLGAGRLRLVRQLLSESLSLSLCGLTGSLLLASLLIRLLPAFLPSALLGTGVRLDARVVIFTVGISLLTVALFGLAPALRASHSRPMSAIRTDIPAHNPRQKHRGLNTLVVGQLALAMILAGFASLVVRSLAKCYTEDLGFERENVLLADVRYGHGDEAAGRLFFGELLKRIRTLPGAERASVARSVPFCPNGRAATRQVFLSPGHVMAKPTGWPTRYNTIDPEYFRVMGIPVLYGRGFNEHDDSSHPKVVMVSEALVRRFWPNEDPLDKQVWVDDAGGEPATVVGVVKDVKYDWRKDPHEAPEPYLYFPLAQMYAQEMILQVKTHVDAMALVASVRREIRTLDKTMPVWPMSTMRQYFRSEILLRDVMTKMVAFLGLLALALASVGLYGVVSYSVSRRTQEIGIRMALGARRADVLRPILWRGGRLALWGVVLGLPGTLALGQLFRSDLYGVKPADPVSIGLCLGLLLAVTILACYLPARRAAGVDPLIALRYE